MSPDDLLYYEKNKHALGLSIEDYSRLREFDHWYIANMEVVFFDRPFKISSPYWFLQTIDEIFVHEVYKFETAKAEPIIIDCGASWGLSVIYLKLRFPQARISAYEADYEIYKTAADNIKAFEFEGVTLHHVAIWDCNCTLMFSSEGSVGGSVTELTISENKIDYSDAPPDSWIGNYNTYFGIHKTIQNEVPAVALKDILQNHESVDFLKIDIEGSEYKVIMDCANELYRVEKMFVEYHSVPNQRQVLNEILKVVTDSGFRYYIKEAANNFSHPFIRNKDVLYDLQLNIFCFR